MILNMIYDINFIDFNIIKVDNSEKKFFRLPKRFIEKYLRKNYIISVNIILKIKSFGNNSNTLVPIYYIEIA